MTKPVSVIGSEAYGSLFDAAQAVFSWMNEQPPQERSPAMYLRLSDAIDGVREAHQMHGFEWETPK